MGKQSNDQSYIGQSVRRTLFLGDFETISLELPIEQDDIRDLGLEPAIWRTILTVNSILLEWSKAIYQSRNFNIGKGTLDKLETEITLIQKQLDKFIK
jgi:hypothetical protein